MKALAGIMASLVFVAGCASGSLYYHERADGTRYYVTRTGALAAVNRDGRVVEAPVMYGGGHQRHVQKKGDGWDLAAFDIGEPPGHCMELLSRRPESCVNRVWEPVALVLMAPVLFLPTPPLIGDPLYIYPSASER
jgi:hypothetical protein